MNLAVFALSVALLDEVGAIQAVCPLKEVVAIIGDDVLLPCYTNPEISLSGSTLDWKRPDKEEIVYVYRNQKDEPQMEKYADRMKVDHSVLQWGNLSLFILSVGPSDSGLYESYIPQYDCGCTVQLRVVQRTGEDSSPTRPSVRFSVDAEVRAPGGAGPVATVIITAVFVLIAVGILVVVNWGNPGLTARSHRE